MTRTLHLLRNCLVLTVVVGIAFSTLPIPAAALTLQEQLDQVTRDLEQIRANQAALNSNLGAQQNQLYAYQGEAGRLRAEMESLQLKTQELQLQLDEVNLNIQILEEQIAIKKEEIATREGEMSGLEEQSEARIQINYMDFRSRKHNRTDFFQVNNVNTYFKDSQYQDVIQEKSQKALNILEEMREELQKDKIELEDNQVSVKREKAILDEQKSQLDKAQSELDSKLGAYYSAIYASSVNISNTQNQLAVTSQEEARKVAEAELIKQQLFNSFSSIPNGQYVLAGTWVGDQGCTGWCTGPHLHFSVVSNGSYADPCAFLSGGVCGYGAGLQWPLQPVAHYTSSFGNRCFEWNGWYCDFHSGIDIIGSYSNSPVYAAHDGYLFKGVDQYGALYAVICENASNCNSGFKTGYWHLSRY
jgi:peptidoglycan hydrolase CwlO-like protein